MLGPDRALAAGGQVRVGAGQRVAPGERVEHRTAWQENPGKPPLESNASTWGARGRVANGINTVHLSCVREKTGHALIGARSGSPRAGRRPGEVPAHGAAARPRIPHQGTAGIDVCAAAYADGIRFDFACGDEVYGNCTQLREFFEAEGQAYVLRVPSNFTLTLATGTKLTCAHAVKTLLKHKRRWEIRSAGSGSLV